MKILVTGGTGFIGTALCGELQRLGHDVTVLSRDVPRAVRHFSGRLRVIGSLDALQPGTEPAAVVNLAGENLGARRWNARRKQAFRDSRVNTTRALVEYMARAAVKPRVLVSGSAVGYYGARGDEILSETSAPGDEYQSELCRRWEEAAQAAETLGLRVCRLRTGIVLGHGGALQAMLPPFRFGLGGHLGSGRQWMSWIHMDDLVGIILMLLQDERLRGAYNGTAPQPVSNREFSHALGAALHRPARLPLPAPLVRLLVGEMARLLLTGQRVLPQRVLEAGYVFRYPGLAAALVALLPPR